MSFDPKCYDLAEAFLEHRRHEPGYQRMLRNLAQEIQDSIEAWFFHNPEPVSEKSEHE